ncbi:SGNH hydrolase [Acaromyces ingoldii]|uniref:SGNH hydrolase n=1 Tax=Acaromyces ingoldii TaxID=215250 RepID=A0A316YZ87_9BASI|nr:SGNH hydrolase [Acaromyces ingoldii]PWN93135.1 SGNH hydrolase [Acaromyces ingoldii]
MSVLQIGNLGSSYAAGPTIPPSVGPVAAGRSGNNFAHLVAKHFNGNLTDLSVSGATLDNVLTQKQTVGNTTFNPQLQDLPPNQDVVFILGGGNDLNYIGGLLEESAAATSSAGDKRAYADSVWGQAVVPDQDSLFPSSSSLRGRAASATTEQVAKKLGEVADQVRTKSPEAQIFLVEYLPLLSDDTKPQTSYMPLSQSRIDHYKALYDGVNAAYVEASRTRQPWLTLVDLANITGHALGSKEPWLWGYDTDHAKYHPMLIGHEKVADKLIKHIKHKK